ncbi:MAG: hypothetical protein QGG48_07680, partial [Desulfatiglandales bacterium]|nr:hypothetical protein [Desulfatiglandales bacterium]
MAGDCFLLLFGRTCLVGLLLGFGATFYLLVGLAGLIGSPVPNMVIAALALLAALFFLYFYLVRLPEGRWLGLLIWSLILLILICEIVLGLVPPVLRDELTHHLALPKLYAKEGKIFSVPFA